MSSAPRCVASALIVCAGVALFSSFTPASAQFATSVASFNPGSNANASFPAANAVGGPTGGGLTGGSTNVCVLGVGGSLTLAFAGGISNGPGADLIAFENPLQFGGTGTFSEMAFVEVSSDGVNFARFASKTVGPPVLQPAFGTLAIGTFSGMVGGVPVLANVNTNTIDPRDAAAAGGEAFDLDDLASHALVVGGLVDLDNVAFVRIVDAPEGVATDSAGTPIFDNGGATGSADIDAVAVVHAAGADTAHQPVADFFTDASGFLHLRLGDPDGVADLDLATLKASFNLAPLPLDGLFAGFTVLSFDGKVAELRSVVPTVGSGLLGALALSVRDQQGRLSGDQVMLQR